MSLTREQIIGIGGRATFVLPVPEWDGNVYVRAVGPGELADWRASDERREHLRASVALLTVIDANGRAVFRPTDFAWLMEADESALDRIFAAAARVNDFRVEDVAELSGGPGNLPVG